MANEKLVEAHLNRQVRLVGGMSIKLAPTIKGLPDRLVLLPDGKIYLVEVKDRGGRLSPAQRAVHYQMARLGTDVVTLYGTEEIKPWIRSVFQTIDGDKDEEQVIRTNGRKYRRWTPDEDEMIMAEDRPDDVVLALRLKRSVPAILRRRMKLLADTN